jgi:hypothetical protein
VILKKQSPLFDKGEKWEENWKGTTDKTASTHLPDTTHRCRRVLNTKICGALGTPRRSLARLAYATDLGFGFVLAAG